MTALRIRNAAWSGLRAVGRVASSDTLFNAGKIGLALLGAVMALAQDGEF